MTRGGKVVMQLHSEGGDGEEEQRVVGEGVGGWVKKHSGWLRGGCGRWVETLMVRHVEFQPSSGMQATQRVHCGRSRLNLYV